MRKIAVFTGTRAEYGLLFWIMTELKQLPKVNFQLFVGGMHLSHEYGFTVKKIEDDGFNITGKLDFLLPSDSSESIGKSMGRALIKATEAFNKHKPDLLVILGDRFEAMAVAQAAMVSRIPIAHIHGGENTVGAIDEAARHSITKMSHLHFTSTEPYRKRVIQLGEHPDRVFNYGAPGIDNIKKLKLLDRETLSSDLGFDLNDPYFLVTFHPVTLTEGGDSRGLENLLSVVKMYKEYKVIICYPNADAHNKELIKIIKDFANKNQDRIFLFKSLGQVRYLSVLKHSKAVVGNSSSGLIEAPSFGVPTLNIGDRQKGRIAGETVIHCDSNKNSIKGGLRQALSEEFKKICSKGINPYGNGEASSKIVSKITTYPLLGLLQKEFYDFNY